MQGIWIAYALLLDFTENVNKLEKYNVEYCTPWLRHYKVLFLITARLK